MSRFMHSRILRFIPAVALGGAIFNIPPRDPRQKWLENSSTQNQEGVFHTHARLVQGSFSAFRPTVASDRPLHLAMILPRGEELASKANPLRPSSAFIETTYQHPFFASATTTFSGNATFVSPHLLLTALHVVAPFVQFDTLRKEPSEPLDERKRIIGPDPSGFGGMPAWKWRYDSNLSDRYFEMPRSKGLVIRDSEFFHGDYELVVADHVNDLALIRVKNPSNTWVDIVEKPDGPSFLYFVAYRGPFGNATSTDDVLLGEDELQKLFGAEFSSLLAAQGLIQVPSVSLDTNGPILLETSHKAPNSHFWDASVIPDDLSGGALLSNMERQRRADGTFSQGHIKHVLSSVGSHSGAGISASSDGEIFAVHQAQQMWATKRWNVGMTITESPEWHTMKTKIENDIAASFAP